MGPYGTIHPGVNGTHCQTNNNTMEQSNNTCQWGITTFSLTIIQQQNINGTIQYHMPMGHNSIQLIKTTTVQPSVHSNHLDLINHNNTTFSSAINEITINNHIHAQTQSISMHNKSHIIIWTHPTRLLEQSKASRLLEQSTASCITVIGRCR